MVHRVQARMRIDPAGIRRIDNTPWIERLQTSRDKSTASKLAVQQAAAQRRVEADIQSKAQREQAMQTAVEGINARTAQSQAKIAQFEKERAAFQARQNLMLAQQNNQLRQQQRQQRKLGAPLNYTNPSFSSGAGVNAKWGNPDAPSFAKTYLTTIKTPDGRSITVNKNSAKPFQGFINELFAQGYRPKSIQSYNNRNIAGTNTKSEHAWANAIDFDPWVNRGDRLGGGGTAFGNLPKNVQQLADKYGITWGGSWKNADPMHFEYRR